MTTDLGLRRQFFAEEVAAIANLKTPQLAEALASLPTGEVPQARTISVRAVDRHPDVRAAARQASSETVSDDNRHLAEVKAASLSLRTSSKVRSRKTPWALRKPSI